MSSISSDVDDGNETIQRQRRESFNQSLSLSLLHDNKKKIRENFEREKERSQCQEQ
jgi:hypothetical protein